MQTQISFKRPLVNLWTAIAALDMREEHVMRMIEEGSLAFAWNIASKKSGKQCVRILASSISNFQAGKWRLPEDTNMRRLIRAYGPEDQNATEWNQAVKEIFPTIGQTADGKAAIRAVTFSERFSANADHILDLVREGSLRQVKGSAWRSGPGGSPYIEFDSVMAFLKARRI